MPRKPDHSVPDESCVLLHEPGFDPRGDWLLFTEPTGILQANHPDQVIPMLRELEQALAGGQWAAGWMAYEAAPGLDPSLVTRPPEGPLLWFGLFDAPQALTAPPPATGKHVCLGTWSQIDQDHYEQAIAEIRAWIARGDTYQVNYTTAVHAAFTGDPYRLFLQLRERQQAARAAYVHTGSRVVASVSPERFFELDGTRLRCRPMKGTRPRGPTRRHDRRLMQELQGAEKDRAENLMIVDMVRHDLGRIADYGSVEVEDLFEIEQHETVLQMTSGIAATSSAGPVEILRALFPSASITGAPKVRTMQLIADLEEAPRGVYTGCIGCWSPDDRARFNVAIRTVEIDLDEGSARYGTGSGIVWDSDATAEFLEVAVKTRILAPPPTFRLLETLRAEDGELGLLDRHLARLEDSAAYFHFPCERTRIEAALQQHAAALPAGAHRIRLLVDRAGGLEMEDRPVDLSPASPLPAVLATTPLDSSDPFLYHKTTHRQVYEQARAAGPEDLETLLWNERGELTECTVGNLVLEIGGRFCTPPVDSGLLAGTLRADLLDRGVLTEMILRPEDLDRAGSVYMINSVRGWVPLQLQPRGKPV